MRAAVVALLTIFLLSGCDNSKPKVRYDPDRKVNEAHPQSAPASVPQAGVDALKDIKIIKKREDEKLKEDQKTLDQIDNPQSLP